MEKSSCSFKNRKDMKSSFEEIAEYLRANPEFFEAHASMLADIQVPNPHDGRAISLSERQILALREKNQILQDKLEELILFGKENDAIAEKMHKLAVSLLAFRRLPDLLDGLTFALRESFLVPHSVLRIWNIGIDGPLPPEFLPVSSEVHAMAENLLHPYCGPHVPDEIRSWFGEQAEHLRSFAMTALHGDQTIGLLVMGSEESQRFYPEMGTVYLGRLGELASASLKRFRTA
ncbi:Protein of unknown function DUF484 [Nitrosospira multiformis ATCC 25196]|uniref:DUF484 family protein n=2 Tax=Nitrosospira multiformis (strain ATCC 25196 / NCIMB 11849 / C 71) TaxID=323848 RepID=Q2Y5Y9_NITMU|nr:Protein of unknown function DUF484 [Nitrosospira multiformis ATCC 25196]